MRKWVRRIAALILIAAILCAILPAVFSTTGKLTVNTAQRHSLCFRLSEQAQAYYTGSYAYSDLVLLQGAQDTTTSYAASQDNELYTALSQLMRITHTNQSVVYGGYGSTALATYWQKTDAEQGASTYLYFYTDILADDPSVKNVTMNREHVWPKSRASFYQKGGGADLHHLRPSINTVNSAKSNNAFANLVGTGTNYSASKVNGQDVIWMGAKDGIGGVLEVRDNVKGDVARILLYVYVRWMQPNLYSEVETEHLPKMDSDDSQNNGQRVIESLDTLLQWMELDPVDQWEMCRNDQIENVQGNRNVFIDYPELAWMLFSREVPEDMNTPSNPVACPHSEQTAQEGQSPTCMEPGWENLICKECGKLISEQPIDPLGHDYVDGICTRCGAEDPGHVPPHEHTYIEEPVAPTCTDLGYTLHICTGCGESYQSDYVPALGHDFVDGICSRCGEEDPDVPPVHDCPCDDYDDLYKTQWYHEGVDYALDNGLMNGMGDRIFNPDGSLTRAMLVTILYRLEKEPSVEGMSNPFTDVPENQWYTEAVIWAADEGIVNGMTETTYVPNDNITREQIATILYRYAGKPAGSGDLNGFADASSVSPYALDAMAWAVGEGIINGLSGSLAPKDNATRAQIATILYRYLTK